MLKLSILLSVFTLIHTEEIDVTLINYDVMYTEQCATSPISTVDNEDNNGYELGYDTIYIVRANAVFCSCLCHMRSNETSYAAAQIAFNACMQQTEGKDTSHWAKIAKRYAHNYVVQPNQESWELPQITTSIPSAQPPEIPTIESTENESEESTYSVSTTYAQEELFVMNVKDTNDGIQFGNAAVYVTFIGASILLVVFLWFVKASVKKWKMREYQHVQQMSESEANHNDDTYGADQLDDDWDDNYDLHYSKNEIKDKNVKFASWNKYSAV